MTLFLISWFAFSYSFPFTINFGVRHTIASKQADVERSLNAPGVYLPHVSVIKNGRLSPVPIVARLGE